MHTHQSAKPLLSRTMKSWKPANRMFEPDDEPLINGMTDSFQQHNKIFQRTHNDLLKERIKILVESQQFEG